MNFVVKIQMLKKGQKCAQLRNRADRFRCKFIWMYVYNFKMNLAVT